MNFRELLAYARSNGHDALGIARDPEGLRFLADARWKRGNLDSWWGMVNTIRTMENLTDEDLEWIQEQDRRAVEIVGFSVPTR